MIREVDIDGDGRIDFEGETFRMKEGYLTLRSEKMVFLVMIELFELGFRS